MLSEEDVVERCAQAGVSEEGTGIALSIRSSPPARRVKNSAALRSSTYIFASKKMRHTVQAESLSIELPAIYKHEFDRSVLEYYDQPSEKIFLEYLSKTGRRVKAASTADFFVIADDFIGWEEWKPLERLIKLAESHPGRIVFDETSGRYRCPPAEAYAEALGLNFRLCTEQDLNLRLVENLRFLGDFWSAAPLDQTPVPEEMFGKSRWLRLAEILNTGLIEADELYALIVSQVVYVNLEKDLLSQPQYCKVFRSKEDAKALDQSFLEKRSAELAPGSLLHVFGKKHRVLSLESESVELEEDGGYIKCVPKALVEQQILQGIAYTESEENGQVFELLRHAGPDDLAKANQRYSALRALENGCPIEEVAADNQVSDRTIRSWLSRFRAAQRNLGDGYVGLLPKTAGRGNRSSRLSPATISLINRVLEEHFLNKNAPPLSHAYAMFLKACDDTQTSSTSEKTFYGYAKRIDPVRRVRSREGSKAAYQQESGSNMSQSMGWDLGGKFAMDVVHTDHTQLDIELVSSRTGRSMGRPWLTIFLDGYSRMPVSFVLMFDPPSYRSLMTGVRRMVEKTGYFPASFVVDGGKEFHSVYFESLVARGGSNIQHRTGKPRHGALIERYFGSLNTQLIDRLKGNTQPTKNVRQMSAEMNPKKNAIWTLEALSSVLEDYLEGFVERDHPSLGCSPSYQYSQSFALHGSRKVRAMEYNQEFIISTFPPPRRGKVFINPKAGIRVNHLDYWHSIFRSPSLNKQKVDVRYDPFDVGHVYAFANKTWHKCRVISHYEVFRGRTERELHALLEEHRKTAANFAQSRNQTMRQIAGLFERVQSTEESLSISQLARDQEQLHDHKKGVARADLKSAPKPDEHASEPDLDSELLSFQIDYSAAIPEDF